MKLFRKRKSENGQAMVEFALVFPMFLLIVMMIIDIGWIGLKTLTFDYSFRVGSWVIRLDDPDIDQDYYFEGPVTGKYIKDEFTKNSVGIDSSEITIKNPYIELTTQRENIIQPNGYSRLHRRRYMQIKADVVYEFKLATPIGRAIFGEKYKIVKKLDKYRLLQLKS